jgi:deoxyribodipyrimidine photo-lyase
LSAREVDQAAALRMQELDESNDPSSVYWSRQIAAFRARLAWRCHFVQKLEQQPDIEFRCMHPAFEPMRIDGWRDDFFDAWCQGKTGFPLIDACMRSLHANGWITFRMRALLVSFASYQLWLDWRRTGPVLARLFTDYEPGIHYSQLQMQSGVTGINAVRLYNPVKQSLEHDPEGKFIRRYVPELAELPVEFIHEPWQLASPPADYPARIVDHEQAAREARARMAPFWRGESFREQATAVFRKLGSRNRPAERRKPRKAPAPPPAAPQLDLDF